MHCPKEYCEYSHPIVLKKINKDNNNNNADNNKEEDKKENDNENEEEIDTSEKKKEDDNKKKNKKDKKKGNDKILIEQSKRGKKKHITYVTNLEKYGLVLKDVAKSLSKKLACSCTVTKEDNGTECITLTGEFADEIFDYLTNTYDNIKAENCQIKIDKK